MPDSPQPPRSTSITLVGSCFLLSGLAALLYETVWLREFSIVFGTSDQALAIVLGTYMGGLAVGSLIASRVADRLSRPLLTYAALELGIAVTALLVPSILGLVRLVQIRICAAADGPPPAGELSQLGFALLGATLATLGPTSMMGATLPMLAKHVVHRDDHLGPRIGMLYTINTLGAVAGTVLAAFVLLPAIGLRHTVHVGVSVNVAIFLLVWCILRRDLRPIAQDHSGGRVDVTGSRQAEPPDSATVPRELGRSKPKTSVRPRKRGGHRSKRQLAVSSLSRGPARRSWILWLIALSGAISFAYEVLFTRMLGHVLGGSVFAFATMLASFLLGITLGAALGSRLSRHRQTAIVGFIYAQCGTAVFALASWYGIESLAGWFNSIAQSEQTTWVPRSPVAIAILTPPAITIGMTFPFAIRVHARDPSDAAGSSAKVYACSTVGGVVGALVTGMYVLPASNYHGTAAIAVLMSLAIAFLALIGSRARPLHAIPMAVALVILAWAFPSRPTELLRVSPFPGTWQSGELTYAKAGRSATVTVYDDLGSYQFLTGGLPEARTQPKGSLPRPKGASPWLGLLPAVVHPDAKEMLVVGLGSGIAVLNAPQSIEKIDVFELEQGIVEANRIVRLQRAHDPLADPRVNIITNDGRSGLALTLKQYDVIVSQPSHPWTAGASHLYTREFAGLVRDHLADDGVFVQWMDISYLDLDLFRSLGATLLDVFPTVHVFQPNRTSLLYLASNQPRRVPTELPELARAEDRKRLASMGLKTPDDLLSLLAVDDEGLRQLCDSAEITTDNNNRLALKRLPRDNSVNVAAISTQLAAVHPLCRSRATGALRKSASRLHVARRQFQMNRHHAARAVQSTVHSVDDRMALEGYFASYLFDEQKARRSFRQAIEANPSNSDALLGLYLASRSTSGFNAEGTFQEPAFRDRLVDDHRAVVDADKSLQRRDLASMPELDVALSRIPPEDSGYTEANLLRIRWRIIDVDSGDRASRGQQSLELIESIVPHVRQADIAPYRLEASVLAGQPQAAVTTARMIASWLGTSTLDSGDPDADRGFGPDGKAALETLLRRCDAVLAPLESDRRIDQRRLQGVRHLVRQRLQQLGQKTD